MAKENFAQPVTLKPLKSNCKLTCEASEAVSEEFMELKSRLRAGARAAFVRTMQETVARDLTGLTAASAEIWTCCCPTLTPPAATITSAPRFYAVTATPAKEGTCGRG